MVSSLQPATKIYNLIRGTNPQPGATTHFRGQRFKVFDSELVTGGTDASPGEIIETSHRGFAVAAINGAILVKRVQVAGSPKIGGAEFAEQVGLKVGDRLGE